MPRERVKIVLGVVYNDKRDRVFIAKRSQNSHLGGAWEFPGGKIKANESEVQALKRELFEEINIRIKGFSPLMSFNYDYPDRSLKFSVWNIHEWYGDIKGCEGQEVNWCALPSLTKIDFPPSNKGIITACTLPHVYLITPDPDDYSCTFIEQLSKYISAGIKLIQFRSKKSPPEDNKELILEINKLCRHSAAKLLINSSVEFAKQLGVAGVHLNSERLMQLKERPKGEEFLVAASCHNQYELQHAIRTGVDFCVLSQIRGSKGESRNNILGWDKFAGMTAEVPVPVYALGGIQLDELVTARNNSAQGIALISDVWSRSDSAARIKKLGLNVF